MMTYHIELDLPPSVNESFLRGKGKKVILTQKCRDWRNYAALLLSSQKVEPLKGMVKAIVKVTFPDNRRRDSHNYTKQLYDALASAGIIEDDSQIWVENTYKCIEKNKRKIEVTLMQIENPTGSFHLSLQELQSLAKDVAELMTESLTASMGQFIADMQTKIGMHEDINQLGAYFITASIQNFLYVALKQAQEMAIAEITQNILGYDIRDVYH